MSQPADSWQPDILGSGFEALTLPLAPDDEGDVVATVVRAPAPTAPHGGAVLYLHGFNDYFFQVDLARWFADRGWAFYGLDLRKYGRSLRSYQTPNRCRSLDDYDEELDATRALIAAAGHDRLLLVGHSTGGLILPLWAARRGAAAGPPLAGMVLNSPFLDFRQPPLLTATAAPLIRLIARRAPDAVLRGGVTSTYGVSLHASRDGEWDYNLAWKPINSFPVRFGWLAAVSAGHRRIRAGLDLTLPVLSLSSTRTVSASSGPDLIPRGDAVLDAGRIARLATSLGRNVTVARIDGGMHDLFLSHRPARDEAYAAVDRWFGGQPAEPTPRASATPAVPAPAPRTPRTEVTR